MISKRTLTAALLLILSCVPTSHAFMFGSFGGCQSPCPRRGGAYHNGCQFGSVYRPWTYAERYQFTNRAYPKYYYGLHANYMQSLGIPPGDIGLRSNGINMTAW